MSVIVRMEMPTGCANCPMGDDDSRFCKEAKEYIPMLSRPSWCPIVGELPEQNGRLVDERELFARCRPVKNFDNPDALVIVKGAVIQSQTIVPATERSET